MAFLDTTGLQRLWAHTLSKISDTKSYVDTQVSSININNLSQDDSDIVIFDGGTATDDV